MYYKILIIITPYINPFGAFLLVHYIANLNLNQVIEYFFLFSFFRHEICENQLGSPLDNLLYVALLNQGNWAS